MPYVARRKVWELGVFLAQTGYVSGGYLRWDDGCTQGYDESARSFSLYLDDRQMGSISCYVNHCEGKVTLPADVAPGEHVLSVEGGSSLPLQVTTEGE